MRKISSILTIVVVVLLVAVAYRVVADEDTNTFTAEFRDAAGLFVGNDVGVLGVKVGEVTDVRPAGDRVIVTFEVSSDIDVPADAQAIVVSRSVATDRYIELTPVYGGGAVLEDGAVIGTDRTQTPVEFDELLGVLHDLTDGLLAEDGSSPLADLVDTGALALEGNGELTAEALRGLTRAMESIDVDDLATLIVSLQALATTAIENDELIESFIETVSAASEFASDEIDGVMETLEQATVMLGQVESFIDEHQDAVRLSINDFAQFSATLLESEADLEVLLQVMPLMMQNVELIIDDGRLVMLLPPETLIPTEFLAELICGALPIDFVCELTLGALAALEQLLQELTGGLRP